MTALAGWLNFYAIVGASAGALIGLQFVVLTLITRTSMAGADARASRAFATPAIVHFGTVLGLSATLSAPWEGIGAPAVLWGIVGISGMVYAVIVVRQIRVQAAYQPEFEDWLFHAVLPAAAYTILAASAYAAYFYPREALFGVGAALLVLLLAGVHNAWDAVTYHVFVKATGGEADR